MRVALENFKKYLSASASTIRSRLDALWEKFHTLSLRERRLAGVSFIVLALIVVKIAIAEPLERNLALLDARIKAEEKKSLRQLGSLSAKPKVDEAYVQLFQRLDAPETTDEEVRSEMQYDIESFARSEDMSLAEVKPQISTERGSYREFTIRLQLDGTLPKLIQFLAHLVRTRKLYYVESFRIAPHPEDAAKIRANVTVARGVFSTEMKGRTPSA